MSVSQPPTFRPVYKALHRRLTVWGVERRLFFLALLMGAATFNLFYSFLAGLLVSGVHGGLALLLFLFLSYGKVALAAKYILHQWLLVWVVLRLNYYNIRVEGSR